MQRNRNRVDKDCDKDHNGKSLILQSKGKTWLSSITWDDPIKPYNVDNGLGFIRIQSIHNVNNVGANERFNQTENPSKQRCYSVYIVWEIYATVKIF